jgi:hypothetical protein
MVIVYLLPILPFSNSLVVMITADIETPLSLSRTRSVPTFRGKRPAVTARPPKSTSRAT